MANRERGEVDVTVGDKTYTLVLSINSIIALEDLLGTPDQPAAFQGVMAKVQDGSARHIRAMFWACLHEHHPEFTADQAGDVIQDLGWVKTGEILSQLNQRAAPDADDVAKLGKGQKRPLRAQGGTRGNRSTSMRVASA